MKILIVQDYLRSGGTERQSVLLANAFAGAGHKVTLLTFRPGGPLAPTISPTVTHRALQPFDTHLDWFAPGIHRQLEQVVPDIILLMGRMANCFGQGYVKETQDRWPSTAVIGTMRTGKKLPWLFRISLRHVRHIVANSHAAKSTLEREHGLPCDKITVIHNSLVFPDRTLVRNHKLRDQHGADDKTTVLLDVAMFRPEKNQRELIAIAAGLPANFPWQLWLAGDGAKLRECQHHARRLGVQDRVKFLGFLRNPEPLYAAADVSVHASRSESLSNFLIESQVHGLPAVAYRAQGVEEAFIPGETGQGIDFGDHEEFRRAILKFAHPPPEIHERARDYARSEFAPSRQVQAYLDLFAKLLNLAP
ncbi:MAG: glycosyltransferase [Opitutaceae bacterium]|nr:glycosyltransferase [Opitutaceae bacterium]